MTALILERVCGVLVVMAGMGHLAFSARGPMVEPLLRRSWLLCGASRVCLGVAVLCLSAAMVGPAIGASVAFGACSLASQWFGAEWSSRAPHRSSGAR